MERRYSEQDPGTGLPEEVPIHQDSKSKGTEMKRTSRTGKIAITFWIEQELYAYVREQARKQDCAMAVILNSILARASKRRAVKKRL